MEGAARFRVFAMCFDTKVRFLQGCVMRCMESWSACVAVSVSVAVGSTITGQAAHAADGFLDGSESILTGLVAEADLEFRSVETDTPDPSLPRLSVKSLARQSVPVADRASFYRLREVFTHSKIAMPLLVIDLEPQDVLVVRPMSGHSVGAMPSANWTRAVSIVDVEHHVVSR